MANIRTARRSGFITRGSRNVRETLWVGVDTVLSTLAASGVALQTQSNAALLSLAPFTITRFRGYMFLRSDQFAASESYGGAWGMAVVTEQAAAIGVTAVPTPITDDFSDSWVAYQKMLNFIHFGDGTGTQIYGQMVEVDSRAMRKVEDGFAIITVVENEVGTVSTDGVVVGAGGRLLLKLH